jgi:hypothetical protein
MLDDGRDNPDAADSPAIDPPNNDPGESSNLSPENEQAIDPPNNGDGAIDPPNN